MLEIHDLRPEWDSAWTNIVAVHPRATPFHQADWLRVLQRTQHLEFVPLGITQNDRMIGLLPLFVKRYGPLRVGGSPFIVEDTPYLGPLIDHIPLGAVLEALRRWATQKRLGFIRLLLPPITPGSAPGCRPATSSVRATLIEKRTHILDLTLGTDQLWRNLREGCRGAIKKARRAELEVIRAVTPGAVHDYYMIAAKLYRAQGRRHPNPRELFQELFERFSPSKAVSLLLARHHGQVIGGVLLAYANGTLYYLDSASDLEGKRLQATNLLLWEAIRHGVAVGAERFDFVGSDIPRLAQFKASFGGSVHPYWCVEITNSRLASGLRRAYPRWKAWVARWPR
jgi:hypothetical protein